MGCRQHQQSNRLQTIRHGSKSWRRWWRRQRCWEAPATEGYARRLSPSNGAAAAGAATAGTATRRRTNCCHSKGTQPRRPPFSFLPEVGLKNKIWRKKYCKHFSFLDRPVPLAPPVRLLLHRQTLQISFLHRSHHSFLKNKLERAVSYTRDTNYLCFQKFSSDI